MTHDLTLPHRGRLALLAAAISISPATARASCDWSDIVRDDPTAATVRSTAPRTHFVKDDALAPGCPNDGPACLGAAYLTPGDVVLTGRAEGRFTCAGFVGARGPATIGWLPAAALSPGPRDDPATTDWTGHWTAPEQDLRITPAPGGALAVTGDATWGAGDPERMRRGGVHTGEVAGTARPQAGILAFAMGPNGETLPHDAGDEFTCRIRMVRRGPYLVVRGDNACGGMNVTFSGFYRRKP